MAQFEQNLIENGNQVRLRGISFFTPEGNAYSERVYKSTICQVYEDGAFKLSLPVEYGDVVPLSLDMIYEIVILTEEETYRGKGKITERFRDETGGVCLFRLTEALSLDRKDHFLLAKTRIPVHFANSGEEETGSGTITALAMNRLTMETECYLEEKSHVQMEFSPEGMHDLVIRGEVRDCLKIRSDVYESEIAIELGDSRQQKSLAKWCLEHVNDHIEEELY